MKVLVCGGRDFDDYKFLSDKLSALHNKYEIKILIHGNAKGADKLAGKWAEGNGIHTASITALWNSYGKGAGYRRNATMLLLEPDVVVAFSGGVGTNMMLELANKNKDNGGSVKNIWDLRCV